MRSKFAERFPRVDLGRVIVEPDLAPPGPAPPGQPGMLSTSAQASTMFSSIEHAMRRQHWAQARYLG